MLLQIENNEQTDVNRILRELAHQHFDWVHRSWKRNGTLISLENHSHSDLVQRLVERDPRAKHIIEKCDDCIQIALKRNPKMLGTPYPAVFCHSRFNRERCMECVAHRCQLSRPTRKKCLIRTKLDAGKALREWSKERERRLEPDARWQRVQILNWRIYDLLIIQGYYVPASIIPLTIATVNHATKRMVKIDQQMRKEGLRILADLSVLTRRENAKVSNWLHKQPDRPDDPYI